MLGNVQAKLAPLNGVEAMLIFPLKALSPSVSSRRVMSVMSVVVNGPGLKSPDMSIGVLRTRVQSSQLGRLPLKRNSSIPRNFTPRHNPALVFLYGDEVKRAD